MGRTMVQKWENLKELLMVISLEMMLVKKSADSRVSNWVDR
jgi:hypothetical protein